MKSYEEMGVTADANPDDIRFRIPLPGGCHAEIAVYGENGGVHLQRVAELFSALVAQGAKAGPDGD
jgi:hypothetical protein